MKAAKQKILIVDDDPGIRKQLRWALDQFDVVEAEDRRSAIQEHGRCNAPVVLLDLGLPPDQDGPSEGLGTLQDLMERAPDTKAIVMTGQTEREYAVQSIGLGAYDFYEKPVEIETLAQTISRAFRLFELEQENRLLLQSHGDAKLPGFVALSPKSIKVCNQVKKFANSDVSILLSGESGTGKEVLARAIHESSPRAGGPYIAVNCAAIPENLLESELFGHEKGAFTGAVKTTVGKVESANKGTFLLDEIGDLPQSLQAKLLRFLQERQIERLGGRKAIPVDIRVLSATNQNLSELIEKGQFREDLYYRLAETEVEIPPLRERPEDAIAIAKKILEDNSAKLDPKVRGFSAQAIGAISSYSWPGNVRELENRVRRAILTANGREIGVKALDLPQPSTQSTGLTLKEARDQAEKEAIGSALARAKGNISEAARLLGTSRPTLYQLLKTHSIKVP